MEYDLGGIWKSVYKYQSNSQGKDLESEHIVEFVQNDTEVTGKSKPDGSGSKLYIRLSLDGQVAGGQWKEKTSPNGEYKGQVFHGFLQLIIDETGGEMSGHWVGFNRDRTDINVGEWTFQKQSE